MKSPLLWIFPISAFVDYETYRQFWSAAWELCGIQQIIWTSDSWTKK